MSIEKEISEHEALRKNEDTTLTVDPGFVNHRKIETVVGQSGTSIINNEIANIPLNTPEWRKQILIDHIYSRLILDFCKVLKIRTIEDCILNRNGVLMCSIENFFPTESVYETRAVSILMLKSASKYKVELHYTSSRISSDTLKSGLNTGGEFAVVAQFHNIIEDRIILHPLLIGYPYLQSKSTGDLLWASYTDFYRLHLEDFDEFSMVKGVETPGTADLMKHIKESVFKACLQKLLGGSIVKDWGGETSDYYTSHIHLNTKRFSSAFLLKGPSNFRPMGLNHLGKNNDQIVRLSKEPVDILVVQHSHDILPSVAETLKVFATQPSNPRRYCLIDGRDSIRLLKAYNLLEWAIEESKQ